MELYTSKDYEALKQMPREDLLNTLQALYDDFMEGTNYDDQPGYVGTIVDFVNYGSAQAISQAMDMLINIFDLFDEFGTDTEGEEEQSSSLLNGFSYVLRPKNLTFRLVIRYIYDIIKLSKGKELNENDY